MVHAGQAPYRGTGKTACPIGYDSCARKQRISNLFFSLQYIKAKEFHDGTIWAKLCRHVIMDPFIPLCESPALAVIRPDMRIKSVHEQDSSWAA
jgi:hypothetical protein